MAGDGGGRGHRRADLRRWSGWMSPISLNH